MRLKKIELFGFKSFAERTVIEFDVGITGVVGPNGCGKSNVADAFRWVLGEQSARSLRGEKMGDVIFAGTSKRKPCQFAEVILTFTEVGGALPVEYEEVAVGRRLYRNGESEYLLNGNSVRLKDIQSLFWDTGLGKDSLAIFEQGKIEEVILRSPVERRPIFESAAGILRFRERRKEAYRKLEQTGHNLSRIEDVTREVTRQMEQLEKQVAEAKEYHEAKGRLDLLERALLCTKLVRLEESIAKGNEQIAKMDEQMAKGKERVAASGEILLQLQKKLEERERELAVARETFYQSRSARDVKRVEADGIKKRLGELDRTLKKYEAELKALEGQVAELHRTEEATAKEGDESGALVEAESHYKEGRVVAERLEERVAELRAKQKEADRERMELVQLSHAVTSQLRESRVRLEAGRERLDKIVLRTKQLQERKEELSKGVEERKKSVAHLSTSVDGFKAKVKQIEEQLKEAMEGVRQREGGLERLRVERTEASARQKVLVRLKEEMETFSPGTRQLMRAAKDEKSPIYAKVVPLFERIKPVDGMAEAVASVLHAYGQTLLAESQEALQLVWEYAQSKGIVGFSLTSPALLKGDGLSLLQGDLHWFGAVERRESMDLSDLGRNVVTPQGVYVDGCGVLFCPAAGESNLFLREAELEELKERLLQIEIEWKRQESELAHQREQVGQLQKERSESDKAHRQEEMKLVEANFGLQRALRDLEALDREDGEIGREEKRLRGEAGDLEAAVQKLQLKQEEAHGRLEEVQKRFHEVEGQLEEGLAQLNACRKSLQEREERFQELSKRVHQRQAQHRLFEAKMQAIERQRERIGGERAESERQRQELTAQVGGLEEALAAFVNQLSEGELICKRLEEEVTLAKEAIAGGDKKVREAEAALQELGGARRGVDLQKEQQQEGLRQMAQEAEERFGLGVRQLKEMELPKIASVREGEGEIHRLRRKLEASTHVNLAAIEEYEEHKKRAEFLANQVGDLAGSKKELLQIIHGLEKVSRAQFKETFEKVRANFQRQFQTLFHGGEADLRFTESQDVLEAGIEIVAKPPGKQMRSITLLSGGEKCLTAMALLFAIFEVNPSPVCILDETDAPLDETNVGRFVEVLRSFLDRTQFVLITHNKKTMESAGVLIGVTMEERGVSRPIEMRLESVPKEMFEPATLG